MSLTRHRQGRKRLFSEPRVWQTRARERSLASARQRADDQAVRLVRAAQEMINEEVDVTVPALVARAGMSTKTFYRHFSSRDELLLATMEDELAIGAHLVRREVDRHDDPVERLRACVFAYVAIPGRYRSAHLRQARVRESRRLLALYEKQADQANEPLRAVFLDVITGLAHAGLIELEDPELTARSIYHLLSGHLVDAAFDGSPAAYERIGEHAWQFCCGALRIPPKCVTKETPS